MPKELPPLPSMIQRIRVIFLGAAALSYLAAVACIILGAGLVSGFSSSSADIYPTVLAILAAFTAAMLLLALLSLKKMQQALHPLARLQEPLHRIAKGDFETALHDGDVDKEIDSIHRALRTTIVALKEREKKRNESAPAIAEIAHAQQQHKATIVHHLSHEIHTPMNGIIGMLDLLRDTELSRTQREFINMAHVSAENLLRRLNNMLDVALVETGQLALEHVAFDLGKEVSATFNANLPAAKAKGVELVAHASIAKLPHVLGNPERIRQIMTNLVRHAVNLSNNGQVIFDVQAKKQDNTCHINISATGNDVPLHGSQLAALLHETASDTGQQFNEQELSLASCKTLAGLLGGDIGAESDGNRTIRLWFSLKLPFAPTAASILAEDASSNVHVLFVSGNQAAYHSVKEQLTEAGLRADSVETATEALNALEVAAASDDPYRIAVIDYHLDGIDGEIFGTALKSEEKFRNILLMLLSPKENAKDSQRFAEAGFSASLNTPLAPHSLMDALQVLCTAVKSSATPPFITAATLTTHLPVPEENNDSFTDCRILIADDNIVNQQVALHILEKLGCHAGVAKNGQEAVDMHSQHPYDLILMDCQMPVMDGYQATKVIRARETGTHTPIIALTAFTMQGEREQCLAAGMDDFLAKPIRLGTMREALGRWLNASAAGTPEERDEFASMQKMFGHDFVELTKLYLTDSPKRIISLTEAVAGKNAARIAATVHSLSGSCASIGATGLAALCKEMETRAKADQLDNMETMLSEIGTEYARVKDKLQAMILAK